MSPIPFICMMPCEAQACWDLQRSVYNVLESLLTVASAYVPMDPAHPPSRLGEIVKLTRSPIVLCSPEYEELGRTIADRAVVIDRKFLDACRTKAHEACSTVTHENACYVIFTSGSTGTPKGSVMTHSGFATAAKVHGERVNLNSESRVIRKSRLQCLLCTFSPPKLGDAITCSMC